MLTFSSDICWARYVPEAPPRVGFGTNTRDYCKRARVHRMLRLMKSVPPAVAGGFC
jgi:hypothetical protein